MVMQTSCKKDMEQMDLLQAFEIIVDKAKNSSLGEKFYEETDSYLGFVSDKLDISKRASAIMALFADRCDDSHIQFSDFTDFLGCRILSLLRYANEIQELVDKEYICRNRDEGFYYTIPMEVMEVFQHNERYNPMDVEELTARELFDKFDELFTKCRRRKIDKQVLRRKLRALVAKNEKLAFVKAMASYDVDADDMYFPLFVLFCTLFVVNGDDDIRYHDLEFIYKEGDAEWRCAKRGLSQGDHLFFVEKFIEYTNDDGFVDRESFKITDDAIIGKRQVGAERAVEKMENSIQNIILQEMEQLDGILIATTNLAENIARHFIIQTILHGKSENMVKSLAEFCESERLEGSRIKRKIGF